MFASRFLGAVALGAGLLVSGAPAHAMLGVQAEPANSPTAARAGDNAADPSSFVVVAAGGSHNGHSMAGDGPIVVDSAWARETTPSAKAGGVFVSISNHGEAADRLIAGSSEAAGRVELHTHIMEGEVMKMRQVQAIDLPAGEVVALEPGGFHVMLIDLVEPLREDDTIPLTLTFEQAGDIDIEVQVMDIKHGTGGGHGKKHSH